MFLYFVESRRNNGPHIPDSKSLVGHGYMDHTVMDL